MPTVNKWAVSIGMAPDHDEPSAVATVLDFTTTARQIFQFEGDGSARDVRNIQSMFVDNSDNPNILVIDFNGGLLRLKIPANSQAILPVASPRGIFQLIAETPSAAGRRIPVTFFDVAQPYIVWKI